MKKTKKFLNDPKNIVPEVLDGLVAASHGRLKRVNGLNVVAVTHLPAGKVGLLIGGGSGHEPLFAGFVGVNMADGAVAGISSQRQLSRSHPGRYQSPGPGERRAVPVWQLCR